MSALLAQMIEEEEGPSSPWAFQVRGLWHIARSTLVDRSVRCDGLCQAAMDAQDAYELDKATGIAQTWPGYAQCNEYRQATLAAMAYQMGNGPATWPKFRAALAAGDYDTAADNMLYEDADAKTPSAWYLQTPARCRRMAAMIRLGVFVPKDENGGE